MASPTPRPPRSPRVRPDVGDAGVPQDVAHRVLLLAHDVAQETLADAQRLAAGVLLEARRQAETLFNEASDAAARSVAQRAAATFAEAISIRHDDIVNVLSEVRDELRGVCDALSQAPPIHHPRAVASPSVSAHGLGYGRRPSLLATDPHAVISPSDEEFLEELYGRIAGVGASQGRVATLSHPDDRVVAVRASARRAAERAAAERAAIQAEALERHGLRRRAGSGSSAGGERKDVVVSMTGRRAASPTPASG
jgi:hypothetical protein